MKFGYDGIGMRIQHLWEKALDMTLLISTFMVFDFFVEFLRKFLNTSIKLLFQKQG